MNLVREHIPARVARIVDSRIRDRLGAAINWSRCGTLQLDQLARDCYLQGFFDAYERLGSPERKQG